MVMPKPVCSATEPSSSTFDNHDNNQSGKTITKSMYSFCIVSAIPVNIRLDPTSNKVGG